MFFVLVILCMRREKRRSNSLHTLCGFMPAQTVAELDLLLVMASRERKRPERCLQGVDQCGQATKGVWGMPWRQEAMKGVEDCDKLGGLVKRELIPRSLNQCRVNP